jgi:NADH-ubiquinone oxidoreductase chain 5
MYLSIIIIPLLGSVISGFFGRKIGVKGAQIITSFSIIVTAILAMITFVEVGLKKTPVLIQLFR